MFRRLFLFQELFVIVMEDLTGRVTHFNTVDNAPEVWDQEDIKVCGHSFVLKLQKHPKSAGNNGMRPTPRPPG